MKKILLFAIIFVSMISVSATSILAQPQYEIPEWIKNNVKWWTEEKIDDKSFVSGIEFLISDGIIDVSITQKTVSSEF